MSSLDGPGFNPYTAGPAVSANEDYIRRAVDAHLDKWLRDPDPNPLWVYGTPRSGKSSLLARARQHWAETKRPVWSAVAVIGRPLRLECEGGQRVVEMPLVESVNAPAIPDLEPESLILVDEGQDLAVDGKFDHRLQALVNFAKRSNARVLCAAFLPPQLAAWAEPQGASEQLANRFSTHEVGPFTYDELSRLVRMGFNQRGEETTDNLTNDILVETGGHPQLSQELLSRLFDMGYAEVGTSQEIQRAVERIRTYMVADPAHPFLSRPRAVLARYPEENQRDALAQLSSLRDAKEGDWRTIPRPPPDEQNPLLREDLGPASLLKAAGIVRLEATAGDLRIGYLGRIHQARFDWGWASRELDLINLPLRAEITTWLASNRLALPSNLDSVLTQIESLGTTNKLGLYGREFAQAVRSEAGAARAREAEERAAEIERQLEPMRKKLTESQAAYQRIVRLTAAVLGVLIATGITYGLFVAGSAARLSEIAESANTLKNQLDPLEPRITKTESAVEEIETATAALSGEFESLEYRVGLLLNRVETIDKQVSGLDASVKQADEAYQRVLALSKRVDELTGGAAALQEKQTAVAKEVSRTEAAIAAVFPKVAAAEIRLQSFEEREKNLRLSLETSESRSKQTLETTRQAREELISAKVELQDSQRALTELGTKLTHLQSEFSDTQRQIKVEQSNLVAARKELTAAEVRLREALAKLESANEKAEDLLIKLYATKGQPSPN
jgi:predicted  nucleic acid-binding Zn-ribbon protein